MLTIVESKNDIPSRRRDDLRHHKNNEQTRITQFHVAHS
jgi:hypothetical protein